MSVVYRSYTWYRVHRGFLVIICLICTSFCIQAQTSESKSQSKTTPAKQGTSGGSNPQGGPVGGTKSDDKGTTVDQNSPGYRTPEKDPFSDPTLKRKEGPTAEPVAYPPLSERQAKWRERRLYNLDHGLPPPDPTEQYLVDEFDVKGVFATERGLGALLKVKNSSVTLFVREGAKFWNGSVTKIDKNPYRDIQRGTIAGTVMCSEVTLYTDKSVKTTTRPLTYVPRS